MTYSRIIFHQINLVFDVGKLDRFNSPKEPANNHNAGELLILAFIEVDFAHNILGNWSFIRQPVIP